MFHFHKQAKPASWRVIGASIQGASHEKNAKPCEDAHQWKQVKDTLIGVVADGAGSASHAEIGSAVASKAALGALETALGKRSPANEDDWKELFLGAAKQARAAVEKEAETRKIRPRDLASTLVCCAIAPDWMGAMQIGDGAVLAGENEERFLVLTKPVVSEYLNETVFLTSPDYVERMQITVLPGQTRRLAMFTDGLQMLALKMPLAQPHIPFFKPLFGLLEQTPDVAASQARLEEFLRSPRLRTRTDDDLTLLLASSREASK
jgi:hypothetical protein